MSRADMNAGQAMNTRGNPVDDEYVKANGLQIIAGTDLSKQDILDASKEDYTKNYYHYIINESAAKRWAGSPVKLSVKKCFLASSGPVK